MRIARILRLTLELLLTLVLVVPVLPVLGVFKRVEAEIMQSELDDAMTRLRNAQKIL